MISRLVMACVAGVVAYLICILVGGLLASIAIPFIVVIGAFLVTWAAVIALLVALAYFFGGGPVLWNRA